MSTTTIPLTLDLGSIGISGAEVLELREGSELSFTLPETLSVSLNLGGKKVCRCSGKIDADAGKVVLVVESIEL